MDNIITAVFTAGQRQTVVEQPLYQWAYGQTLRIEGLDLPEYYQVDFSNFEFCGASIPQIGGADGVSVPVEVLATGAPVYAFVWLQDETGGKTAYRVTVSVIPRPAPDFGPPSPEEESAVAQAIVALNDNAEDAEAWAVGERDGVPVAPGDPTYENNAKYYAEHSGGGGGTSDYTDLTNKPSINGVTLSGNKTASDLGLGTYSKPSGGIPASDLASGVIPTKTSDLTNDSGFTTHGVPNGGTRGQVLKKSSGTDYAVEWANESGGGGIIDVSTKVDGELTSANIAQAILDALEDGSIIYIPAGDYTFNVAISTDCTILLDDECYISTASQTPCISASNCSIAIYGGNIYSGEDVDYSTLTANDDRRKPLGWGASNSLRGEDSIIRLMNCHDCTIKGVNSPWHNSLFAIFASNCRNLVIESCSFDKILRSAVFLDGHCEKVAIRNCVFKNSRYAVDSSGNPQYWCYFVYTGVWSNSDLVTPPDGLIFENNYCYNSEDCGLDTHGARNVIMRNNTVLETVCALTAYNDNRRVKRPAGWCMDNVLIENNYCESTKSNDPRTEYRHPFIFLGNANGHSASEADYADNPGSYYDFRNCIVRNNTFISASDIDYALSLNVGALDLVIENNYLEFPNAAFAIGAYQYLLNARIEGNTYERNRGVAIPNGSSVKIDCGVLNTGANMLREIIWTAGLGLYMGQTRGTVVCAGEDIRVTDNRLTQAIGYGKRITGSYTGSRTFTVTVADGVCTLVNHHLLPGMRVTFTASGSSTATIQYVEKLLDYERFVLYQPMTLANGTYTMELTSTSFYNTIPSDAAPVMDGTAAAGSSESYARGDHVHPTDTSRLAANQGAANAGKFLVVGNNGAVVPVTMAAWQGGSY